MRSHFVLFVARVISDHSLLGVNAQLNASNLVHLTLVVPLPLQALHCCLLVSRLCELLGPFHLLRDLLLQDHLFRLEDIVSLLELVGGGALVAAAAEDPGEHGRGDRLTLAASAAAATDRRAARSNGNGRRGERRG
uniref:Uncharacterized protein n=1 Tax=Zea mays TaxID=4577 RepID=C0PNJ9_MAIZE|nr:unknown [Zea mays]